MTLPANFTVYGESFPNLETKSEKVSENPFLNSTPVDARPPIRRLTV